MRPPLAQEQALDALRHVVEGFERPAFPCALIAGDVCILHLLHRLGFLASGKVKVRRRQGRGPPAGGGAHCAGMRHRQDIWGLKMRARAAGAVRGAGGGAACRRQISTSSAAAVLPAAS